MAGEEPTAGAERDLGSPEIEPGSVWGAVVLDVPTEMEERVLALVPPEALGVDSQEVGAARSRLTIYLSSPAEAVEVGASLGRALERWRVPAAEGRVGVERVADGRWVERYQAGLRPFSLTPRFVVHPAGPAPLEAGQSAIVLVPGRAFGTGEHPTTRSCALALERHVRPGSQWIDLGCGTAILAIVAHHCGAGRVRALDHDTDAVAVAEEVIAANGLRGEIEVAEGSMDDSEVAAWDGIVANVSARYFLESAPGLTAALVPGGVLVASGFLVGELSAVRAALSAQALSELECRSAEGWSTLVFVRGANGR